MEAAAKRIEDYGFIGNMRTAALIDRDAAIEWLCMPRFDSDACCAALLGERSNGYWQIAPRGQVISRSRRYRGETLVLETLFETDSGCAAVIDFMPLSREGEARVELMRIVEGREGRVDMECNALFRFDYGDVTPLLREDRHGVSAIAGADALRLCSPASMRCDEDTLHAAFSVAAGECVPFTLTWHAAFQPAPEPRDALRLLDEVERWWLEWSRRCDIDEAFREPVVRSLITLKALTDDQTGGMVAAASCSLPESIGGELNWDYRYAWLRDSTFTLYALLTSGYRDEACAWRQWLLRAAAGEPGKLQPIYGIAGERRVDERTLDWLSGFNGCRPVRIGNGAYRQLQLDMHGEVMDGLHVSRMEDIEPDADLWRVQYRLAKYVEAHWQQPGAGLWELRGPQRHYTHSKVMSWVAIDRAIKGVENFGLEGELEQWKRLRQRIHDDVCTHGFKRDRNSFVQHYGSDELDASLLLMPLVGFLPASDPRIEATVEAIQRELTHDGFIYRFVSDAKRHDLTEGEGAFLVCCFWLVDVLLLQQRRDEARALFDKLLSVRNDLGLLAEEYHPVRRCLLGNFPQAFSHVGLVNSAHNFSDASRGHKPQPARARQSN